MFECNFSKSSTLSSFIEISISLVGVLVVRALKWLSERSICNLCFLSQGTKGLECSMDIRTIASPVKK